MPLPKHVEKAQVIITKLDQPHRFDFAMQCACGFQHHGFAAAGSNPVTNDDETVTPGIDTASDMISAATAHLAQKHGVDPAEADKFIEVTPFTTTGGMSHEMLKGRLVGHAGTVDKTTKVENIKVTTPPQSQSFGISKDVPATASPVPAKAEAGLNVPQKPVASPTSTGTKLNEFPASQPQLIKPNPVQPGDVKK